MRVISVGNKSCPAPEIAIVGSGDSAIGSLNSTSTVKISPALTKPSETVAPSLRVVDTTVGLTVS